MDVHCSTCGKSWEVCHLRHVAIFDTLIAYEEAEAWQKLNATERLSATYREHFRVAGWQFGQTVFNVLRCPNCLPEERADPAVVLTKSVLEELLVEDENALARMYWNYQL